MIYMKSEACLIKLRAFGTSGRPTRLWPERENIKGVTSVNNDSQVQSEVIMHFLDDGVLADAQNRVGTCRGLPALFCFSYKGARGGTAAQGLKTGHNREEGT